MESKDTYGRAIVFLALLSLLLLLICSLAVSFHIMDLLYIICLITFLIRYYGMK